MKKYFLYFFMLSLVMNISINAQDSNISKASIKSIMDKVNHYQFSHPWTENDDNWIRGTYYTGVMACYQSTGDVKFLQQCDSWGEKNKWAIPAAAPDAEESGANLITCGQTWLESYMIDKKQYKIQPLIEHLENPDIKNPTARPLTYYHEAGLLYVDALFVCPPAFAMLFQATKNPKYLAWMDSFFWNVYGALYDENENLFYRDLRFRPEYGCIKITASLNNKVNYADSGSNFCYKKTRNGKKVIWSRGNGWAFAGIARILKYTPKDYGNYNKYLAVYVAMAKELKKRQQADGFWYPNLDDPDDHGTKESSGTGFFTYGIAWGINNGILSREEFLPVIEKSWNALVSIVSPEGKVQWGQLVGANPYQVLQENSHEYVTGTFLLAASEMYILEK